MKSWILLVILSSVSLNAQAPAEKANLTLAEAVHMALERHPDVGKAKAAVDVLKGKIREVRAQALPYVSIGADATRAGAIPAC